jgi:hypothetical protein
MELLNHLCISLLSLFSLLSHAALLSLTTSIANCHSLRSLPWHQRAGKLGHSPNKLSVFCVAYELCYVQQFYLGTLEGTKVVWEHYHK